MKKLFVTTLIAGSLFFMPAAEAAIEVYIGEGQATMSEDESQDKATDRAKLKALRHAQEQAGVYIKSQSRMRDLELVEDEVETITGGIMKIQNTDIRKSLSDNGVIQVFVTVTVQIDTDALQREIDRLIDKRKAKDEPKTPIDRPKPLDRPEPVAHPKPPVEEPKPKPPVEQPKPPVEQPKPPVEQPKPPVEQPTPIEPPKPVEPIKPPTPIEPVTPPSTEPSKPWLSDEQIKTGDLMELINNERAKVGKKPLTRNSVLVKGARVRVEELTQKWSDKRPDGSGWWTVLPPSFQQKSTWEYIHSGYNNPQEIIDWYLQQNDSKILSTNYTTIGIAYFYKPDSAEKYYWVVILSN